MSKNTLEDRIAELEMRLAFQDDVINTLSEQVIGRKWIFELWDAKKTLHKQLKDISPSNIRPEGGGAASSLLIPELAAGRGQTARP